MSDTRAFFSVVEKGDVLGVISYVKKNALLINSRDDMRGLPPHDKGNTPLMIAAWRGHLNVAAYLLAQGAAVNEHGYRGRTALMYAANYCHSDLIQLLLKRGANVNATEIDGTTALMEVVKESNYFGSEKALNCIKQLINRGAKLVMQDSDGNTVLTYAKKCPLEEIRQFFCKYASSVILEEKSIANKKGQSVSASVSIAPYATKFQSSSRILSAVNMKEDVPQKISFTKT